MFDPSKLDLDNTDSKEKTKSDIEKNKEKIDITNNGEISIEVENIDNEEPSIENVDILKTLEKETKKSEFDDEDTGITEYEKQIKTEKIKEKNKTIDNSNSNNISNEENKTTNNINLDKQETSNNQTNSLNQNNNRIYDINITTIESVLKLVADKEYSFATFEPDNGDVKITFKKDSVLKDTKYIKYPIFYNILIKAKSLTNLTIEETENEQEGSGEVLVNNKNHKIISKVVPSSSGIKLFIKAVQIEKKSVKRKSNKTDTAKLFGFLGVITFIALVIGGAFIGFIVMNARTIEDVQFFASLGINLGDINNFIGMAISVIFSILVFIETIFLIIYLFKLIVLKKEFKQKKIKYGILSTVILIMTFITASLWMVIDQKIDTLPAWGERAKGNVQLFDNSKLINDNFDKSQAALFETKKLIGPIEIKFDVTNLTEKKKSNGTKINNFIWDFGGGIIKETPLPTIIYKFNKKGNHLVKLEIEQEDIEGTVTIVEVDEIPSINLSYYVDINEKKLNNGGKLVTFIANGLKELGRLDWYFVEDIDNPVYSGNTFRIGKPIFEEKIILMKIEDPDNGETTIKKLFIISEEEETALNGEITYEKSLIDDLQYQLKVENQTNDFGNGYIEEYKWIIGDKEISKEGDVKDPTKSSKIDFYFESYGKHEIKVRLTDSAGEIKELTTIIDIPRKLKLAKTLKFYNDDEEILDVQYEQNVNEYYINQIGIPTTIKIDARYIKSDNLLYTLKKVDWDYNSDGDIDESTKEGSYAINLEGNHTITVYYYLVHRKIENEVVKIKEQIFIEGLRKEAIIDFDINKTSSYVPTIVGFDASKSQVKDQNIEKFIWDYGDGIIEESDSIIPGHRYLSAKNYKVKLTVITSNGKEYSVTKNLILQPKPKKAKITSSLSNIPVGQGVDFSSEKSEGNISGYLWKFGDGSISTKANPTHIYKKAGTYKVTLKLDFENKNTLDTSVNITVYE